MSALDDLLAQAVTPRASTSSSPLATLGLVSQLAALRQRGGGGGGGGGSGGLPIGAQSGPLDMRDFQNWAQKYGQSGVPESLLVPLLRGSYPATDNALWARPDLAAAFRAASKAYHGDTGQWLRSSLVSAWRPFQSASSKATDMKNSDHWLAGAIDLAANSQADQWMRSHGVNFGFDPRYSGFNWGDPGHFSFSAGGFYGSGGSSGDRWGIPTQADARWIELARRLFG